MDALENGEKIRAFLLLASPATDAFWTFDLDFWADQDVLSCLDTKYCGLCSFEKSWNNGHVV